MSADGSPSTRAQRREAHKAIRSAYGGVTGSAHETIGNIVQELNHYADRPRRPGDVGDVGAWVPAYVLTAMAAELRRSARRL